MISQLYITIISLTLAGNAYCQTSSSSPLTSSSLPTASTPPLVSVTSKLGGNITLPCRLQSGGSDVFGAMKVTWTKVGQNGSENEEVLLSMGIHTSGKFKDRAYLVDTNAGDASLVLTNISMEDMGKYHCEVQDGMEDIVKHVILEVENGTTEGVVFPYAPHHGRYNMSFDDAVQACSSQGAVIASFEQLLQAWEDGLDWCNAGWLDDGTVHYPIKKPREPCGGAISSPGIRSYGRRNKQKSRFDVFCFASKLEGQFYWLTQPDRLTYDEAVQMCKDDNAEIAKVGHMYAAWKLEDYDRCDAGWLADGSVRYPISRPRKNCSPTEAAVRFVGFPDKKVKSYGVYCFKPY
ncbi:hyaluronan and proteoglycan link protein 1-like [Cyprinodon tularosa]|uniref:hyaluronan and proteoglycan link protein 1-like n=1 Tax=Cyprinodon tularosa TaxID=77115 RepID=UPI0018E223B4|nr:hyaluronan and proteoglycan link protein 1-like [Cyprinodon tularosa]